MKAWRSFKRLDQNKPPTTRKHIPWISSPLDERAMRLEAPEEFKLNPGGNLREQVAESQENGFNDPGYPVFKTRHESSKIELFYDLFFVANLTTFTADNEITNLKALGQYMGFFCLMWFTWLQASLFDVRFSLDCAFSRFCKLVAFGVMTGFFVVGSQYDTLDVAHETRIFRAMSVILGVSRLALALQYGVVWLFVRRYQNTLLPLTLTAITLSLTGIVYLVLFFGFHEDTDAQTYLGWYVLAAFEALSIIAIPSFWKVINFKRTHLVERIGLLTLIIMGEGIIGMSKSIAKIMQTVTITSSSDAGVIIAAILLIYFVWVLYFDQIEYDRFGSVRQEFWVLLHFPLHVALLLTEEGNSQFIVWNSILGSFGYIEQNLNSYVDAMTLGRPSNFSTSAEFVASLNQSLGEISQMFRKNNLADSYDFSAKFAEIQGLDITSADGKNQTLNIVSDIFVESLLFVFHSFDVETDEIPEGVDFGDNDLNKVVAATMVFTTVLLYFFIAAGAFLIIIGIMNGLGKKHSTRGDLALVGVRIAGGIGLTLLCLLYPHNAFYNLLGSAWMIPIVVIVYGIVIVIDNLLTWRHNKKSLSGHRVSHVPPRVVVEYSDDENNP